MKITCKDCCEDSDEKGPYENCPKCGSPRVIEYGPGQNAHNYYLGLVCDGCPGPDEADCKVGYTCLDGAGIDEQMIYTGPEFPAKVVK